MFPKEEAEELEEKINQLEKSDNYILEKPPIITDDGPRFVSMLKHENEEYEKEKSIINDYIKHEDKTPIKEEEESLEQQLKQFSRSRSLSKDEDEGLECFKKDDYDTVDELKEDLDCDDQICNINTHECIDRVEDQTIGKIDNMDYTYSTNENIDLISKLKQKFKHISITPSIQKLQAPVELDVPVIDMEVPPAHVSTRVPLKTFVNTMQNVQSKTKLSIEQRFNDRTKARREMIRQCLNLE